MYLRPFTLHPPMVSDCHAVYCTYSVCSYRHLKSHEQSRPDPYAFVRTRLSGEQLTSHPLASDFAESTISTDLLSTVSILSERYPSDTAMPKQTKSSASAGTRKKHAKKAGKGEDGLADGSQQQGKGAKKLSKAQRKALPKVKQYIPPPRPPAPLIPDPLDGQGLARTLPADLVVVLRRLGKKDDVTRRKGLEELREGWVVEISKGNGDEVERELKETALLEAVPIWVSPLAMLPGSQTDFRSCTILRVCSNHPSIDRLLYSCTSICWGYPPSGRLYSIL